MTMFDASKLRSVKRGKFEQLKYDGGKIELRFDNCTVVREIYDSGKYVRLDLTKSNGDKNALKIIHHFIQKESNPNFSPLKYAVENNSWSDVVLKISNATWEPFEKYLSKGQSVDVVLSPGAHASFGWCLLIKEISVK